MLGAIVSVQVGSAVAKGLFDDLGAAGVTLLRLGLAALILLLAVRPRVRSWSRDAWVAAALLGTPTAADDLSLRCRCARCPSAWRSPWSSSVR